MKYKGIEFEAIVATPCCGKSYLCDKYPDRFVDADEVRLRCKYIVPEGLTRNELEKTKCDRPFARRADHKQYVIDMENALDRYRNEGKILILAPHPEAIEYLVKRNIKFAFVYQNKDMKEELENRMRKRGNAENVVKYFSDMFDDFYEKNIKENKSVLHYEFGKDEYLEDIIKLFGIEL